MATSPRKPSAAWQWAKRCAALLVIAWLAHWAYVRLTTPAMTLQQAYARFGPFVGFERAQDGTEALLECMSALPSIPPFNLPAPAGMSWQGSGVSGNPLDLSDMNVGSWLPVARPYLRACIDYVSSSGFEQTVADMRALRGTSFRRAADLLPLDYLDGIDNFQIRTWTRALTARSRYCFDGLQDNEYAWETLKTLLWLIHGSRYLTMAQLFTSVAAESLVLDELIRQIPARGLSDVQLDDIERTIAALPALSEFWTDIAANEQAFYRCTIATRFAATADGNGWLMLSESLDPAIPPRSSLWNLLTGFHHDLNSVDGKVVARFVELNSIGDHGFPACLDQSRTRPVAAALFTPLDGEPLLRPSFANDYLGRYDRLLEIVAMRYAQREAVLAAIGLERCRSVHGSYPQTIDALAPAYLREVPRDPFCGEALHYALDAEGYRLWSCHTDRINQGGLRRRRGFGDYGRGEYDRVFTEPRGISNYDPILMPIVATPGESAGSTP